ncbi:MAG: sulfotransferase family protein, partial [Woeseiaceae bacterium]
FEDANTNFKAALHARPTYYEALAALLNSPAHDTVETEVERARQALAEGDISTETRIRLEHALGKFFERKRDYDRSFEHIRKSKEIQKRNGHEFDIDFIRKAFDKFIGFYTKENIRRLAKFGSKDERPVFVLGMPRTGTSLTEQILSSHTDVHGAGELKLLQDLANRVERPVREGGLGGLKAQQPPLTKDSIEYLARLYLEGLHDVSPDTALRVVDKCPTNFMHVGLISILFPKARIIHCRREPLDVALSCYMVLFKMRNDFSNDFCRFHAYYKEYLRLMAHWGEVLPGAILHLQYEDLVREPERTVKKLVALCDLPWDEACLHFTANERAVRTPSNWQVR